MKDFNDFLRWQQTFRDSIVVKRIYIDMTGDFITGVLFSRIVSLFFPLENGSKLTLMRDGKEWLPKKRSDWWEDCRISPKQCDRSIAILKKLRLVEVSTFKFNGDPTKHIHLNKQLLLEELSSLLFSRQEEAQDAK